MTWFQVFLLGLFGALGGFVKSILNHSGALTTPTIVDTGKRKYILLGTLGDILLGMVFGLLTYDTYFVKLIGVDESSISIAFFVALASNFIVEGVLNRVFGGNFPPPKWVKKVNGKDYDIPKEIDERLKMLSAL